MRTARAALTVLLLLWGLSRSALAQPAAGKSADEAYAVCTAEAFAICKQFEDREAIYNECFKREIGACRCLKPEPPNWDWGPGTWCTAEDRRTLREREARAPVGKAPTHGTAPTKSARARRDSCRYRRSDINARVAVAKACYAECDGDASVSDAAGTCFERCTERLFCD